MRVNIWKWVSFALIGLIVAMGLVVCVAAIMAHCHNISLFSEFDSWFIPAKAVSSDVKTAIESLIKLKI